MAYPPIHHKCMYSARNTWVTVTICYNIRSTTFTSTPCKKKCDFSKLVPQTWDLPIEVSCGQWHWSKGTNLFMTTSAWEIYTWYDNRAARFLREEKKSISVLLLSVNITTLLLGSMELKPYSHNGNVLIQDLCP